MNRRTFNTAALASLLMPLAHKTFAQQITPGYQIAEIINGQLATGHRGLARPQTPVNDQTLFQVASCSKTVTALAILTLVRDRKIALDQPANGYLRRWKLQGPRGEAATIAELMSHTAGTTIHGFAGYGPDDDLPDLIEILSGRRPANSETVQTHRRLFRRFKYSGGGTMVLQAVIEDVTGVRFAKYVAAEVLNPVGAGRATFDIKPEATFAYGSYENGHAVHGGFRRHPESAAAGLWATATDLCRVFHAVQQSYAGKRDALIPRELAVRMVTPVSQEVGLGVFVHPGDVISHDGRNFGFGSIVTAELETGSIRAAVTNRNGAIERYARAFLPD